MRNLTMGVNICVNKRANSASSKDQVAQVVENRAKIVIAKWQRMSTLLYTMT